MNLIVLGSNPCTKKLIFFQLCKINKNFYFLFLEVIDLHISAEDKELLYISNSEMDKPIQMATPKKAAKLMTSKKAVNKVAGSNMTTATKMASKEAALPDTPLPEENTKDPVKDNEMVVESEAYDTAASEVNNHWEEPSEEQVRELAFQKYRQEPDPIKARYTYNPRRYEPAARRELKKAKANQPKSGKKEEERPIKKAKQKVPDHNEESQEEPESQLTQDKTETAPLDLSKKSPGHQKADGPKAIQVQIELGGKSPETGNKIESG